LVSINKFNFKTLSDFYKLYNISKVLEKRKKMNAKQTEAEEYKTGKKMKLSII